MVDFRQEVKGGDEVGTTWKGKKERWGEKSGQ
jgi:hypothetical protein